MRQRIVRHIGVAMDEDELERPEGGLGNTSRRSLQMSASRRCLRPRRSPSRSSGSDAGEDGKQELPVDLKQLVEEQRLVHGGARGLR